jgi:hypothetical protein
MGHTEEEARERIIGRYKERAKHWQSFLMYSRLFKRGQQELSTDV